MDDFLRIVDTARKEEIFVYEALKEILFKNKITYIGDDVANGLADIFTDDLSIGVEVVTCERKQIHKFTEKNRLPINFSMNIKSDKLVSKGNIEKFQNYKFQQNEFYNNLKISITKKLTLLKQGNYMGTREIYLCICSVYEQKPYIDLEKVVRIYRECVNTIKAKFNLVFLLINKNLYMINAEFKFALMEDFENSNIKVDKIII